MNFVETTTATFVPCLALHEPSAEELAASFPHALEQGELELLYQPQVDVQSGEMIGVEALVRWHHAQYGQLSPNMFVKALEGQGCSATLDRWVLAEACCQRGRWTEQGLPSFPVSVNISALQMGSPGFARLVLGALERSNIPARDLQLEITETVRTPCAQGLAENLYLLESYGVAVCIDDFGTGYSCLRALRDFAISKIKISHDFVSNLPASGVNAAIVSSILSLARELRIDVIAEGVETAEQLAFLRDLGCRTVQGFLFSRPISAAELARFVHNQSFPVLRAS